MDLKAPEKPDYNKLTDEEVWAFIHQTQPCFPTDTSVWGNSVTFMLPALIYSKGNNVLFLLFVCRGLRANSLPKYLVYA